VFDITFIIHFVCVCAYNLNVGFVFLKGDRPDYLKARFFSNSGMYFIGIKADSISILDLRTHQILGYSPHHENYLD